MSIYDGIALLLGLILGQYLILQIRFSEHANEYIWMSLRKLRVLVFWILLSEWLLSMVLVAGIVSIAGTGPASWLLAVVGGLLLALLPLGIEQYWISRVSVETFQKPTLSAMLKLGAFVLQRIETQVQRQMEEDNLAWQSCSGEWKLGVRADEVGRRIRKLYEFYKLPISNRRKKPSLMRQDVGVSSGQKFYLLVKHLGRQELIRKLARDVEVPTKSWNGKERRRVLGGTVSDRRGRSAKASSHMRCYDDQDLMKRIGEGKALD